MGQIHGRLPNTWHELIEEKDRVLRWSLEVLARVDDNITNEDTYLMDYDTEIINSKVNQWIDNQRNKWHVTYRYYNDESKDQNSLNIAIEEIADEMKNKLGSSYREAYTHLNNFGKKFDALDSAERRIHAKIMKLETLYSMDHRKFASKFLPLRREVFMNLRRSEKMLFEEMRLKFAFKSKVYDIDHKYMEKCLVKLDKHFRKFEKRAEVSSSQQTIYTNTSNH